MSTLIALLILAVIVWFCFYIIDAIPVPTPFNWVIKAIIGILAIAKLLSLAGLGF